MRRQQEESRRQQVSQAARVGSAMWLEIGFAFVRCRVHRQTRKSRVCPKCLTRECACACERATNTHICWRPFPQASRQSADAVSLDSAWWIPTTRMRATQAHQAKVTAQARRQPSKQPGEVQARAPHSQIHRGRVRRQLSKQPRAAQARALLAQIRRGRVCCRSSPACAACRATPHLVPCSTARARMSFSSPRILQC